jgi:riboflavin kinase / FMN adenylyltransferase
MAPPSSREWCCVTPDASRDIGALPGLAAGCVATVGAFDGIHLGHQAILGRLRDEAALLGVPSLVISFRPHPLEIVNPAAAPGLLTPGEEQLEQLATIGVDYVALLRFTNELASLTAEQFVERLLLGRFHMRSLLVGHDHGLGRGREGSVDRLKQLGSRLGFPVEVVPAVIVDGAPVSSSAIRRAIAYGNLDESRRLLGRRYSFAGQVVPGQSRGRLLGYPTLNLALPSARKLLPPPGVYAVLVETVRGTHGGMMNLGPRPTFGDSSITVEAHLFDADGDWYGLDARVQFVRRLRDTVRFSSPEALVAQLARDSENARAALTQVEEPDTLRGSANNPSTWS